MQLLEVERRTLESRVREGGVDILEADGLQRQSPLARDVFDNLLFCATRFALSEGDWDNFRYGVTAYLDLTRHSPQYAPRLVPIDVYAAAAAALSDYRSHQEPGEPMFDGSVMLTHHNQQVGERLLLTLGGDLGDGIWAAGQRTFSHMMAARISDGLVHPAVGGNLWGKYMALSTDPLTGGTHITVMREVGHLSQKWIAAPAERPRVERMILDHAHGHGWSQGVDPNFVTK